MGIKRVRDSEAPKSAPDPDATPASIAPTLQVRSGPPTPTPRSSDEWLPTHTSTTRTRATDHVFLQLAGAILRGQLQPNQPLPPERDLATRFDISRVLVREAIHRLKELGLVRVKQGGHTTVLDPDAATDPRVMALALELAPPDGAAARDLMEHHLAHAVALLELAENRMVAHEVEELEALVADYARQGESRGPSFAVDYWTLVAAATRNKVLSREARWWMSVTTAARLEPALVPYPHEQTLALYEETTNRLRRREHAATFFLEKVRRALQSPR
jgi:GntR family transcriptional regulator, transcriptional repressor for pyruvate dehydrogenase complex